MNSRIRVAVVLGLMIAGLSAAPQLASADAGPIQMPGTNHWYQFVTSRMAWAEAEVAASLPTLNGMQGHLVTIESAAENSWLFASAPANTVFWIGARDVGASDIGARTWKWVVGPSNGVVITACAQSSGGSSCVDSPGVYNNWGRGGSFTQPDNYGGPGSEMVADFNSEGAGWADTPESGPYGFIVEFEPTQDGGAVQMPGTDHWYRLVPGRRTWENSRDLAGSMTLNRMAGHLATITSASEQKFVAAQFAGANAFLGAKDVGPAGRFARNWTWMVGPEAGTVFTRCVEPLGNDSCTSMTGLFTAWGSLSGKQDYLQEYLYLGRTVWDDVDNAWQIENGDGFLVEFEPSAPSAPTAIVAVSGDSSANVRWIAGNDGGSAVTGYTVTASPGAATCTTTALSCTVPGLTNRQLYTFTVTATNAAGTSERSEPSAAVMPLAPGFQTWPTESVLAVGASAALNIAQAAAGASIAVTGSTKASLTADSAGFASASFVATKAGVQKFTVTYSVKAGKKTTKYTTTAQLYVPSVSGPMLKIKTGKTGKFSLQFMPPGAAVSIALTDGQTISGIADAAGKATFTPTFTTKGAVNYSVTVAGVQIATGGLTVN